MSLTLVSHALCPYVQRAAIVLAEKRVPFDRRWVDLSNKPAWFTAISPLGKTPVLLVGHEPIFESTVICEYLEEAMAPRLHADDPLVRARERGWVEFGSAVLNAIGAFYSAPDEAALRAKAVDLRTRFLQVEAALGTGPWFAGERFGLVDAAFGPVFRYFDVFDAVDDFGCLGGLPKLQTWRASLATRPSVRDAVAADYALALRAFLAARGSALSARLAPS